MTTLDTPPTETPHYHGHRKRLRERFLANSDALPDYELLELLLFASHPRGDVKPLAKSLLKQFGSLRGVLTATPERLSEVASVGEATISALKVVEAAAQRLLRAEAAEKPVLQNWKALLDYCQAAMGHKPREEFRILFLNHKNRLLADEVQQTGTVNHTPVYPREVVKRALELSASAIILAHNHPSGDCTPSQADIDITRKIGEAATAVGIQLHDHLVIAADAHFSFRAHGML